MLTVRGDKPCICPPPSHTHNCKYIPVSQHKERKIEAIWRQSVGTRHIMQENPLAAPEGPRILLGSLQRSPDPLAGGEGLAAHHPNPPLSALRASPRLSPTPKLVSNLRRRCVGVKSRRRLDW